MVRSTHASAVVKIPRKKKPWKDLYQYICDVNHEGRSPEVRRAFGILVLCDRNLEFFLAA